MYIGNRLLFWSLRLVAQSTVCRCARMPTLFRSLAIAVPISLPCGKYGRLTGMYQKSNENPFGYPASASSFLDWVGLYVIGVRLVDRPHIPGGMAWSATAPYPA